MYYKSKGRKGSNIFTSNLKILCLELSYQLIAFESRLLYNIVNNQKLHKIAFFYSQTLQ